MVPLVAVVLTPEVLAGADVTGVLAPHEQQRRDALAGSGDRDDFLAARLLARRLLQQANPHGADAVIEQRCDTCGGPHGRPRVLSTPEMHVSWAHADGLVAAAVSTSPVGVDVAWIDEVGPPIRPRVGGASGWVRWTRTEALVKRGDGELFALRQWPLGSEPAAQGITLRTLVATAPTDGVLTDLVDDGGRWIVSVAADQVAHVWDPRGSL